MKKGLIVISTILVVLMIVWLIISAFFPCSFWSINFQEWVKLIITIIIGFFVAYILVEKNTKARLFKEIVIKKIDSLCNTLSNDCKNILSLFMENNWKIKLLVSTKDVSNAIELLTKYSEKLNAEKEIQFIREQFAEYRSIVTDSIENLKKNEKLREKASLKIVLIISKLDEIKLKQYA